MKIVKIKISLVLGAAIIISGLFIAYTLYSTESNSNVSLNDQEIRDKFECDRLTADWRQTDVFCDSELYRNPTLSRESYFEYLDCEKRLESPRNRFDVSRYTEINPYDACVNKTKFNEQYLKFIEEIKKLKAEN